MQYKFVYVYINIIGLRIECKMDNDSTTILIP
jgi:hypothetical protein